MSNSIIRGVTIFGAIAIVGILAMQLYLLRHNWKLSEEKFEEKVLIALNNTARNLAELNDYSLRSKDLIRKAETNYFVVNFNNVIDANNLEFFLQEQLAKVALAEDFEYGIYDCADQEMMYGNYVSFNSSERDSTRRTDLPTYDEFEYYFGVRFPNRQNFIITELKPTFVMFGILLLTVTFFAYALFVILRQKKLSDMQKDFINNMTHEFKTPISTIKLSADFFNRHPAIKQDERLSRYASIISEQNQRLNRQVEKVLQLARIEQQHFTLNKEALDLHKLLAPIINSTEVKVKNQDGTLQTQLAATQPSILADRLHLTNILHNLLDNAVKYSGETPHISIVTEQQGKHILLSIQDQGIGIPKEHQERVFQKFYRVPTGNVHDVKGFGLGLYYVRNICLAHGWKISLDSDLNKGTCVNIRIPVGN